MHKIKCSKTMKPDEQIVYNYLLDLGYSEIEPEPDCNVTPDLLINKKIAVEVRRLNQNFKIGGKIVGLEQDEITLHGIFRKKIEEIADNSFENSAWIYFNFKRPIPNINFIKKELTNILKKHKAKLLYHCEYKLSENFIITIFPSEIKLEQQYNIIAGKDNDTGEFYVSMIYENLKLIIHEKEEKIKNFQKNYSEWWLVLVDYISPDMSDLELQQFHQLPKITNSFDKILIVSPKRSGSIKFLYE